jgi:glycosyltransferase involved in cell wall biosynthesis
MKFISIALCTYNGARYLQQQLDSIADQTLLPGELVACDDGSSDETVEILKYFAGKAPFPVHIHINVSNLGVARNFEKCTSLCTGELIALCDQDDAWKPEKLEKLAEALNKNPEAGYVFCDAELVDENLTSLKRCLWDEKPNNFSQRERQDFAHSDQLPHLLNKNMVTGACMMFRASLIPHIAPIPPSWIHDYWIATIATALGHRGIIVDEPLVFYRQHQDQQIGVLKGSTITKLRASISRWPSLLQRDINRAESLLNQLLDLEIGQDITDAVKQKKQFLAARQQLLSSTQLARVVPGIKMLMEGFYRRFSPYGYQAFLMDLICSETKQKTITP